MMRQSPFPCLFSPREFDDSLLSARLDRHHQSIRRARQEAPGTTALRHYGTTALREPRGVSEAHRGQPFASMAGGWPWPTTTISTAVFWHCRGASSRSGLIVLIAAVLLQADVRLTQPAVVPSVAHTRQADSEQYFPRRKSKASQTRHRCEQIAMTVPEGSRTSRAVITATLIPVTY